MLDVFVSYARSTETHAQRVADALRAMGYSVWRDDALPAHRPYTDVIEENLAAAKVVVVIWSAEAVRSEWVRAEANRAREHHKLVQLSVDDISLPLPFDQIQCADMRNWSGDISAPGWQKVVESVAELVGRVSGDSPAPASPQLPTRPSLVVMPFTNLSVEPGQDYFADGMVAEITNALSRFKSIFVIANSSSMSFKNKAVTAPAAARLLGVRYVLEGSIRKAGSRVRIAVQLIDAESSVQIWTRRFDETLEDVFALQDNVALSVAAVIEPTLQSVEIQRATKRRVDSMGSYDLYLRALSLFRAMKQADMLEALALLDRAIALDPDNGPALGLAANCHQQIARLRWAADVENHRRDGLALAHRSLAVAPDDALVVARAAFALWEFEKDAPRAIALMDRAIDLNPGASMVWRMSGLIRLEANPDLAIEHLDVALRLDPMGPERMLATLQKGAAHFVQRRFAEALVLFKEHVLQSPSPLAPLMLAATYGHLGETVAAREALARFRAISSIPLEDQLPNNPTARRLMLEGIARVEADL